MFAAAFASSTTKSRMLARSVLLRASPNRTLLLGHLPRRGASAQASRHLAALGTQSDQQRYYGTALALSAAVAVAAAHSTTLCEPPETKRPTKRKKKKKTKNDDDADANQHLTPYAVAKEDFEQVQQSHDIDSMPIYSSDQVAENNGEHGKPIWMSYGGVVYDVTNFIPNHPGGSEKILMAAGSAIEPFWHIYRQHFASDLPTRLMEHMAVGRLAEKDQEEIDEQMQELQDSGDDPYALEPERDPRLIVHSDTPMNAETPQGLLTESWLTPPNLFYIRHHHPVPFLSMEDIDRHRVEIDVSAYDQRNRILALTLDDLKRLPKTTVNATLQCSGNRRSGFNDYRRTSGTTWGQGAISNAGWTGVRLSDVLALAGLDDPIKAQNVWGIQHVIFEALDGMMASIPIEKAVNPYGDVILCYEMNGEPLPRDHGGPLRVIVPGFAAVRNVKWISSIKVSPNEADGPWQRGLNYKTLPPGVTDANDVSIEAMPSMTEASVFSGITKVEVSKESEGVKPGATVLVSAKGWTWAGGGRNIVRLDVSPDNGKTWNTATLKEGSNQRFGKAWAWTFWECNDIPCKVSDSGEITLASKAVDLAFNSQPESSDHGWNVRGLGNNSWFRRTVKVC